MPKFTIAMLYTDEIREMGEFTSARNREYAEKHGYGFELRTQRLDCFRPASWSKLLLVRDILESDKSCEWVMWIDADAVIVNQDFKLESLVDDSWDLIVAEDLGDSPFNMGVFLAGATPALRYLFRLADGKQYLNLHPNWEQPAVQAGVKEMGDVINVSVVPRSRFNSFPRDYQPGHFVLHCAGSRSPAEKLADLKAAVAAATPRPSDFVLVPPDHVHSMDLAHVALIGGLVLSAKPSNVLELGIGPGYTSRAILAALKYNGRGDLYCVDNFVDNKFKPTEVVADLRRQGAVVHQCAELDYLAGRAPAESFDVLVSDADHHQSHNWVHLHLLAVRPGGHLIYHDVSNPDFPNLALIADKLAALGVPSTLFNRSTRPDERCERGLLWAVKPR